MGLFNKSHSSCVKFLDRYVVRSESFILCFVKTPSKTYQRSFKPAIFLLLAAFMLPMSLNAKHFAEFCWAESAMHHDGAHKNQDSCHSNDSMDDPAEPAHNKHGECHTLSFCTCETDLTSPDNDGWIIPKTSSAAVLTHQEAEQKPAVQSADIPFELELPANRHAPPIWLLYDTLLI